MTVRGGASDIEYRYLVSTQYLDLVGPVDHHRLAAGHRGTTLFAGIEIHRALAGVDRSRVGGDAQLEGRRFSVLVPGEVTPVEGDGQFLAEQFEKGRTKGLGLDELLALDTPGHDVRGARRGGCPARVGQPCRGWR